MQDKTLMTTAGLDVERVGCLLWQEFRRFQAWVEARPVPECQQARGHFIAWIAAFCPEAVPKGFINALRAFVSKIREADDYRSEHWWRILPLDVALSTLTNSPSYLRVAVTNVDHEGSQLRLLVFEALAVVAERLDGNDEELRRRTAHNLETHHFYADHGVALVTVARGVPEAKRALLNEWRARYRNTVADDMLRDLTEGREHPNPFIGHMLWLHQYACLRLMQTPDPVPSASGKDIAALQARLPLDPQESLGQVLWRRMRAHPLMAPTIGIPRTGSTDGGNS